MDKLTLDNLEDFLRGTAFLGTGGGGDPYVGGLMLRQELEKGIDCKLIKGSEVDDNDLIVPIAVMGAPTVIVERLPNATSCIKALRKMEELMGRKATALIGAEAGGINGTLPFILSSYTGLPVIDADGMGRAFPELQMCTFGVYGVSCSPVIVRDEKDNEIIVNAENNLASEQFARVICMQMGTKSEIALYPMTGKQMKDTSVHHTCTLAYEIGKSIREARDTGKSPLNGIIDYFKTSFDKRYCKLLFEGKVTDLLRESTDGWAKGTVKLTSLTDSSKEMVVELQNEFLIAKVDDKPVAMVPDLICLVDLETAEPITAEAVKYGQRVHVIGVSVPDNMRTKQALDTFGPVPFKVYDKYIPIEEIS